MLKVCKTCQKELPYSEYYLTRGYFGGTCKSCIRERSANWKKANPDYNIKWRKANLDYYSKWSKEYTQKRYAANAEKYREYAKKWRQENPESIRRNRNEQILNLTDSYIKGLICFKSSIKRDSITPELIELKREQILLQRATKELTNELKKHNISD